MEQYKMLSNVAVSENGFLFLPSTGESFTLNEVGKTTLDYLKEGDSSETIIDKISEVYDVDKTVAERDFNDFINQLKNFRLVDIKWKLQ